MKKNQAGKITLISALFYLFLIAIVYGVWKYTPMYWELGDIDIMLNSVALDSKRADEEQVRNEIVKRMRQDFGYDTTWEDVFVKKGDDWLELKLYYTVTV